ncbi:alpha/beta hydrolase family protein [Candidatus Poriferisodalis sp.]|uniref:alpha/beta hydrolase family protein n=1 Tax=Candidatus Poriferisodalis sp. TaxID=3101277 RepID=UPI003B524616
METTRRIGVTIAVFLLLNLLSADGRDAVGSATDAGFARQVVETTAAPRIVTVPHTAAAPPTATVPHTAAAPRIVTVPHTAAAPPYGGGSPYGDGSPSPTTTTTTTTTLPPLDPLTFESLDRINMIRDFSKYVSSGRSRWERSVPGIEQLRIISTADGAEQPVFWLAPSGDRDQPVLVILHSWSAPYTQHAGIPFAMWAQENGWAVIVPEFRGKNDDADAVGSDLAVQDTVDAIDYAVAQAGVDTNRVYVVGYSGGGMMGLLLAGRHPDKVSAVSVWGPPHDLVEFYEHARRKGLGYASDIRRACGGDPRDAGSAQEECLTRSPATYLEAARDQAVPIFIAQGIRDQFVPPSVGAEVFNQLAHPDDRLSAEEVDLFGRGRVPGHLSITTETYFGDGDPAPVFARQSGRALLVYFQSSHEMVYNASARWFASDPQLGKRSSLANVARSKAPV